MQSLDVEIVDLLVDRRVFSRVMAANLPCLSSRTSPTLDPRVDPATRHARRDRCQWECSVRARAGASAFNYPKRMRIGRFDNFTGYLENDEFALV